MPESSTRTVAVRWQVTDPPRGQERFARALRPLLRVLIPPARPILDAAIRRERIIGARWSVRLAVLDLPARWRVFRRWEDAEAEALRVAWLLLEVLQTEPAVSRGLAQIERDMAEAGWQLPGDADGRDAGGRG